jgi:hypothetical protein
MAFWTEQTNEPKRNYRFLVEITGLGAGGDASVQWWAKNFKVPSYEISEVPHDFMDNKYYFPGRLTWADCSMQLVDPVSPNAVALTNQVIVDSGYSVKTNSDLDSPSSMSKSKAVGALGNVIVSILNSDGTTIEQWTLKNPFIKSVTWSDLSYDNDELRTIDITFRYDWAVCDNSNAPQQGTDTEQFGTE